MQMSGSPFGVARLSDPPHLRHYSPILDAIERAWYLLDRDTQYDELLVDAVRELRLPYLASVPHHTTRLWRERWWDVELVRREIWATLNSIEKVGAFCSLLEAQLLIERAAIVEAKDQAFLHELAKQPIDGQRSSGEASQAGEAAGDGSIR